METGELLTRWTVRMAMLCYVTVLALRLTCWPRQSVQVVSRGLWTAGCLAYLLHVVFAFHFFHAWNHNAAYTATAQRTFAVTGLHWGGGLYANYLFTLIWLADVVWWWRGTELYEKRSQVVDIFVHGFLAFIALNATVVFGAGLIRWFSVAACVLLAAGWFARHRWLANS